MSEPVVLTEYQDRPVALAPSDAAFIATQLRDRFTIRRTLTGDAYLLNPRQHVGLVTLPSGRRLESHPKVPARNLFAMLAIAYELPDPFLDAPAEADRIEDVLAFVVTRFAALLEERLDVGLYGAYVENEENLATVRGRIVVAEDMRRNSILRYRTYCRFTDYSWDVAENQVLRQVVQLLAGWRLPAQMRRRLQALDAAMAEITPGRFVASDLVRFTYHRLNEDYQPLHALCRLLLDGASPSEDVGPFSSEAFLLDMNRLFEAFVTQVLQDRVLASFRVDAQVPVTLDLAGSVPMRPDVLIRRANRPVLVTDCKYKRLEAGEHRHHDLYQMLAYCTALGLDRGLLIYPRHLAPFRQSIAVRNADVVMAEVVIDLGGDADMLRTACDELGHTVVKMAAAETDLDTATL